MGTWLRQHGIDSIGNQERYRCLLVLENLPAITARRDGLDEAQRRRLNHPGAVWFAWRRATADRPTPHRQQLVARQSVVEGAKPHKTSRAVHWPQDALQRAAAAIRETRSNDCITQAKAALEAAIRNEDDLLALLGPPEPIRAPGQVAQRQQRTAAMSASAPRTDIAGAAGDVR
jgi:hypothetical protein